MRAQFAFQLLVSLQGWKHQFLTLLKMKDPSSQRGNKHEPKAGTPELRTKWMFFLCLRQDGGRNKKGEEGERGRGCVLHT